MAEQGKRRIQIHLSTVIPILLVAGGFILLNLKVTVARRIVRVNNQRASEKARCFGWPLVVLEQSEVRQVNLLAKSIEQTRYYPLNALGNVILALACVVCVGYWKRGRKDRESPVTLQLHLSTVVVLTLVAGGYLGGAVWILRGAVGEYRINILLLLMVLGLGVLLVTGLICELSIRHLSQSKQEAGRE